MARLVLLFLLALVALVTALPSVATADEGPLFDHDEHLSARALVKRRPHSSNKHHHRGSSSRSPALVPLLASVPIGSGLATSADRLAHDIHVDRLASAKSIQRTVQRIKPLKALPVAGVRMARVRRGGPVESVSARHIARRQDMADAIDGDWSWTDGASWRCCAR